MSSIARPLALAFPLRGSQLIEASAGTGKTFTTKIIHQALLCIYNNTIENDPDKLKGLVVAYTGKEA